jgi:hypothetical protein
MSRPQGQETERTPVETRSNPTSDNPASGSGAEPTPLSADGLVLVPLAAAAALDPSVFSKVNASEAIPASWEDRARKAWEYYLEEPLVKNCVNSWRTFAVGEEIKIAGDDGKVKWEAVDVADRLSVSEFVKDMILLSKMCTNVNIFFLPRTILLTRFVSDRRHFPGYDKTFPCRSAAIAGRTRHG